MGDIRQRLRNVTQQIERAARDAADGASDTGSVTVSSRHNVVVARNVGGSGSTRHATARQSVHFRQQDGATVSESIESSGTTFGSEVDS